MLRTLYSQHLTPEQLRALTEYKYRGEDRSITYKYLLSPFYSRLVHFLPLWLAPNAVTFIGFLVAILGHVILLYYALDFHSLAPSWVYLFAGISLFFYMVMDNLDGKQARRTGSSSPLGHLFDHGCDALNVTISGMSMLAAVQLGPGFMSMSVVYALGQLCAFFATLEEYFTGAMILREFNGPNEGILTLCMLQIVTGIAGPQFWTTPIYFSYLGVSVPPNHILYYFCFVPTLNAVVGNAIAVFQHLRTRGHGLVLTVYTMLCHSASIILFGASVNGWAWLAWEDFERKAVSIMWLSGLVLFDLISRMILATLTRAPFPFFPRLLGVLMFCAGNAIAETAFAVRLMDSDHLTSLALVGSSAYCAWRIWCLITQICEYLDTKCFALGKLRDKQLRQGIR